MAEVHKKVGRKSDRWVKVLDPDGKPHEVSHRNAYDLINHKGWSFPKSEEDEVNDQAKSPRRAKQKNKDFLPKGVEKSGDAQKNRRRVPASRNPGPGPHIEDEKQALIDAEAAAQTYDDDDIEGSETEPETDAGNADAGDASPAENEDD